MEPGRKGEQMPDQDTAETDPAAELAVGAGNPWRSGQRQDEGPTGQG